MKKTSLVVHSCHHQNTGKVARAMAKALDAEVCHPPQRQGQSLDAYDLVGFGAGIDSGKHYAPLLAFAASLSAAPGKAAFIFSTGAIAGRKKMAADHAALRDILTSKGYTIVDEFACRGYNTNGFLRYIGGINRGRPNAKGLENAAAFAQKLMDEQ